MRKSGHNTIRRVYFTFVPNVYCTDCRTEVPVFKSDQKDIKEKLDEVYQRQDKLEDYLHIICILLTLLIVILVFISIVMMKRNLERSKDNALKKAKTDVVSTSTSRGGACSTTFKENGIMVNLPDTATAQEPDYYYDSTDDEEDTGLTSKQKKNLCKEFEEHDWIRVWKFTKSGFEVHVDKAIEVKDASDSLSKIFTKLKLPGEIVKNYQLLQVEEANFRFTCEVPQTGGRIAAQSPRGFTDKIISVGPYLDVRGKGYHMLSAGHGDIEIGWTCFNKPTEDDVLGPELGETKLSIFHDLERKLCDIMLIRLKEGLAEEPQNIIQMENGALELKMYDGKNKELEGKKCIKFTNSERQETEGTVECIEFYHKERDESGQMRCKVNKAVSVVHATDPTNTFSSEGESGMLVAVVPEEGNGSASALGIISGIHTISIDGRTYNRTLLTPFWRAWAALKSHSYCRRHSLVLK